MRSPFDGLAVRLAAAFLLGAALFQGVLLIMVLWPGGPGRPVFLLPPPEEAEAMAEAMEAAPVSLRPTLLRAMNSDVLTVTLEPDAVAGGQPEPVRQAQTLQRMFSRYAEGLGGRPFAVQVRANARLVGSPDRGIGARGPVRLVVRLRTGGTLVLERKRPTAVRRVVHRALWIGLIGLGILGLVLLICLRQIVKPIAALAEAARAFARDLTTPDLPIQGPRELKDLSSAFNDMKRTIRALMDDRTRMLAAIAHDMRTYLTRLRLRAEFIKDDDQRARAVRDLDEMSFLLDDTLTFACEASAPVPARKPRLEVLAELSAMVAAQVELGADVALGPGDPAPLVALCAPLALRRMLANLVDNAVRYGGAARLSARRAGERVLILVDDNGPGAPPEDLARLLKPFERLEGSRGRQTGGAGLGLAIVQALAISQGGAIRLENRDGGGLRAVLSLPAAP